MPGGKKRWWILVAMGVVAVVVIAIILSGGGDRLPASQTLPDGTVVSIVKVSYGKTHRYIGGNLGQRLIYTILPDTLARRLSPKAQIVTITNATDTIVVFVQTVRSNAVTPAGVPYFQRFRTGVRISDGVGGSYYLQRVSENILASNVFVEGFKTPLVSHLAKRLDLQVSLFGLPQINWRAVTLATSRFLVWNPAQQLSVRWTAPPLPLTNKAGDVTVELLELGTRRIEPLAGSPAANGEGAPSTANRTYLRYRTLQNGVPTEAWRIQGVRVSDAEGNSCDFFEARSPMPGTIEFTDGFSPPEARKFRFELIHMPPFDVDETVTLTNITLPIPPSSNGAPNEQISLDLHGYTLHIDRLTQSDHFRQMSVKYHITPQLQEYRHFVLIKSTDVDGKAITVLDRDGGTTSESEFGVGRTYPLPVTSERVDIVFVLTKPRFVEFLARPDPVETNSTVR